jgi:hypothetical protein
MIIEGSYVHDEVGDGEPLTVLFGVEKPCACLNMNVDYQIEDKFEQSQRELHMLSCIEEAYDLGKAKHPKKFQDRDQAQLLKDVALRYLLRQELKGYRRDYIEEESSKEIFPSYLACISNLLTRDEVIDRCPEVQCDIHDEDDIYQIVEACE